MCQRLNFCACTGGCLLKNEEENFKKKILITLVFKLKALVIGNNSDRDGDI